MQKLDFGNCCGQTLDFPFCFFLSLSLSWLRRASHDSLLFEGGNSQQHWTLLTLILRTLPWRQTPTRSWSRCCCWQNDNVMFLPKCHPPFCLFPLLLQKERVPGWRNVAGARGREKNGWGGGGGKFIYPVHSDLQESDKFQHHLQLHHQTHWSWFHATNQPRNHRLHAPRHPAARFSNSKSLWQLAEIITGTGRERPDGKL